MLKAINTFNEFRAPEAIAKLIKYKDKRFLVEFSGYLCYTCGTYDYFDDLVVMLEDNGLKAEIKEVNDYGEYFLVEYEIKA